MRTAFVAEDVPEVVEPLARGQRHSVDALVVPRIDQARDAALRFCASVALDLHNGRTARLQRGAQQLAATVATEDDYSFSCDVEELGQREQALAVHRRRWDARVGDAYGSECGGGPRSGREGKDARRPGRRIADTVFDRVGADKNRDVVAPEIPLHVAQRRHVGRWQDDDRRKDERPAAQRRDLARQPRRLPRRTRDDDPCTVERARHSASARIAAAPRARNSVPSASPSVAASPASTTTVERSLRTSRWPSRLAMRPRSHSLPPAQGAY